MQNFRHDARKLVYLRVAIPLVRRSPIKAREERLFRDISGLICDSFMCGIQSTHAPIVRLQLRLSIQPLA